MAAASSGKLTEIAALALAAAAVVVLFSLAISQILLGIALAACLASFRRRPRPKFEMPVIWIPLALYMLWTALSMFLAPPVMRHMPQIKKMFVLAILPVGYLAFGPGGWFHNQVKLVWWTTRAIVATACLSSVTAIVQFIRSYFYWQSKNQDFYANYQLDRIGGFNGHAHWMAFSGQMMVVLMLLGGWLTSKKRAPAPRWEMAAAWISVIVISVALLLSFTRGAWLGCGVGLVYLLWHSRRSLIPLLPLLVVLGYMAAPDYLQERVRSIIWNKADHSAGARRVMYRAGWAMIKAHPFFGIGPEGPQYEFDLYRPDAYFPKAWYGHLHSDYLQTAASRGLPALVFLVWFFVWVFRDQHRLASRSAGQDEEPSNVWIARGVAAASISYYVEGALEYNFGGSQVVMLWLFLLVLGYAVRSRAADEGRAA
jgi:putative inorganic carbon (hco3(-)) transporter